MKMKLFFILLIAAVLLCGCAAPSSEQLGSSAPPVTTPESAAVTEPTSTENPDEPIQYRIYADYSMSIPEDVLQIPEEGNVQLVREYVNIYWPDTDLYNDEDAERQRTFTVCGKTYTLNYEESYRTSLGQSTREELHQFGAADTYSYGNYLDKNHVQITVSQKTNRIIEFGCWPYTCKEGDLTQEQAEKIASSIFVELYGEALAQEYQLYYSSFNDSIDIHHYTIQFNRYIGGYLSNDWVSFSIDVQGNLFSIVAHSLGVMEHIESEVALEMIANAEAALSATVPSYYQVIDKQVTMDMDGNCYLYCRFAVPYLDPSLPEEILNNSTLLLYINVN